VRCAAGGSGYTRGQRRASRGVVGGALCVRFRDAGCSAVGNAELVAALSGLVQRENDLMSDLLAHLAELDHRRLYLDLGYTSLFAYCTEALGFCKSSAGRRIAVARVCRKYPEAFGCVARGELQLSVLFQRFQRFQRFQHSKGSSRCPPICGPLHGRPGVSRPARRSARARRSS
jgi:hypothetical protein